jgi:hypothetical protein
MTRNRGPRCGTCKRPLYNVRLVIDGWWTCPDFAYRLERGEASVHLEEEAQVPHARGSSSRGSPQAETLFPLERYEKGATS